MNDNPERKSAPSSFDASSPKQSLDRMVQLLNRIHDITMRQHAIMEKLVQMPAEELVETLHHILAEASQGKPAYRNILDVLADIRPLVRERGLAYLSQACYLASTRGYDDVNEFLGRSQLETANTPGFAPDPNQLAHELTLGERKSMAMNPDPDVIERLLFDPDPSVINRLLLNPRMTTPLVVRMAARRPNRPATLREIFQSRRWFHQYEVRLALTRNPYTPPELSMKILPGLRLQHIKDISTDSTLNPELRAAAKRIYSSRAGKSRG